MQDYIKQRAIELAEYIISTGATVRDVAKIKNISKSTVHKDITERLVEFDNEMANEVQKILDFNLSVRHIRGGISTAKKYSRMY